MQLKDIRLSIVGLGYVGLPLAVEFSKIRPVVGFDINQKRIDQLNAGHDSTLETEPEELLAAQYLNFTTSPSDLKSCNCFRKFTDLISPSTDSHQLAFFIKHINPS